MVSPRLLAHERTKPSGFPVPNPDGSCLLFCQNPRWRYYLPSLPGSSGAPAVREPVQPARPSASAHRIPMQGDPRPELVVDPAMLAGGPDHDSDDEYEYDCNGVLRPPKRRQDPAAAVSTGLDAGSSSLDNQNDTATEAAANDTSSQHRFQLLDLSGPNPIVSYQNTIFSCSWNDLIGTELLFTDPENQVEPSDLPFVKREKDFGLLAVNSVKLVGQKANLVTSSGTKAVESASANSSAVAQASEAQHQRPRTIMPKTTRQTDQALFLERLMNAKQAKNEKDIVRTVFGARRGPSFDTRLQGWARTEERMAEIQNLNRAMLQGDVNAMMSLEQIYSQIDNNNHSNSNTDAAEDSSARPSV
ncbi:hypothetical protein NFIA_082710 [Paecilomyces variotii No. 5]|uniref:Transcription factor TFIIIC triple barrel domain-containing protein n=1 Tax=Byssochlamys spectabilis (strain No. 5 / NBRC 109023) TaxID=1356009 RepID=V5GCJ6_BYSSN|nr:hypothetical protein NFIA_082710 [Paecilomyces variotii No. 5]